MIDEFGCINDLRNVCDNIECKFYELEEKRSELESKLSLAMEAITPLINAWTFYKLDNSVDPKNMDVKELDILFEKLRKLE